MISESDITPEDWIHLAEANIKAWAPDVFFEVLRTPQRDAYASLFQSPKRAIEEITHVLKSARVRDPHPFHIMNIEAPGGCWELGTQINPATVNVTAPNGEPIKTYAYRFVFLVASAIVVDERDVVRHQCNNRACVRPDHLLLGRQTQNRLDDRRRLYAGNSPQGRGQTLHAHIPKHLQLRPDPFVEENLALGEYTDTARKTDI